MMGFELILLVIVSTIAVGLLAGLTLLVVWAVRRTRVPSAGGHATAKEILQSRYVRREITREQYELMKQDIG